MSDASNRYVKRRVTVDSVTWTAVVAAADCRGVGLKNSDSGNGFKIRTDQGLAASEDSIPANSQEVISAAVSDWSRFKYGEIICYVQANAGTGPMICTFAL